MDDISREAAPTLQQWPFTEDNTHRIPPPTLIVLGTAHPRDARRTARAPAPLAGAGM